MDIKCGVLSKHLFERTQQHGGYTKHLGKKKFVQEILFAAITWNQNHSSKKVVSMINTLGKDLFCSYSF